jgi:vacuolar protein sorting-associated protein 13A/C
MVAFKGNDRWIRGQVKGLTIEGGSGLVVVDPVDISAEYACVQDRMTMMVAVSDISMRLSFSVISLVLRFHDDALSTFHLAGMSPLSRCTHFDRIWANISSENPSQQVAIWRPRAPPGYMILGDCATSGVAPPAQAVMAISNTYPFAKKPLAFKLIWSSQGDTSKADNMDKDDDQSEHCCVWMPVAPPGYLALGCVAERGHMPPSPSVFRCIHSDLVTSGSLSDCIFYIPPDER